MILSPIRQAQGQDRSVEGTRFGIIGLGGLGGPVAYALAAAGAGRLLLCDHDLVELSNLQRQVQFSTADVGTPKVFALAEELVRRGYPRDRLDLVDERFENNGAASILAAVDVVIDGTDNFPTKFLINDRCVAAGRPFVIGAVLRYGGQVIAVRPPQTACYRCLFEGPPTGDDPMSCADAGVLGAAVATIAGFTARAALALARGDDAQAGVLHVYDDLRRSLEPRRVRFHARPDCLACAGQQTSPIVVVEEAL
ncbi:MAG TPA: ThiF family adenylyltransferase [Kofleriaceae bacterium]|nr:ThiF family adenylyltransferase [Kofleriaceae bacterium]